MPYLAEQLLQDLQAALAAQPDGADMWVDLREYDEPESRGMAEAVSAYVNPEPVCNLQTFVITYN